MQQIFSLLSILVLLSACRQHTTKNSRLVQDIIEREKSFQDDLNQKGAAWAFGHYAAENATIRRENDSLIHGPAAITHYYENNTPHSAKAYWKPDAVEVSGDGTMAYTYGKYRWEIYSGDTLKNTYTGIFHTVWKKEKGEWKYVWD